MVCQDELFRTSSPDGILCRGLAHHHEDLHFDVIKKNRSSSFYEHEELDLNKHPCDESFSQCKDLSVGDSSRFNLASPSHIVVGESHFGLMPCSNNKTEQGANFTQTSSWIQQDAEFSYTDSEGKSNGQSDAVEKTNRIENEKKQRPLCSSESFESIVLKLPESDADDYCVTSKLYEVDDTSTKDSGIKLRRGARRIKDFRKDVLPHLASLSPEEIWEDMKIMEVALRSREYKRLRSEVQNKESGSIPLKSRSTRSNCVARRRKT